LRTTILVHSDHIKRFSSDEWVAIGSQRGCLEQPKALSRKNRPSDSAPCPYSRFVGNPDAGPTIQGSSLGISNLSPSFSGGKH